MTSGSTVCFGIIVMVCQPAKPAPIVSDFCRIAGPQIAHLQRFTDAELSVLQSHRKVAILKLRETYRELCK